MTSTNDLGDPAGSRTRFPRSVFGVGAEPDPRFTLANERTFLAWIRTALALIAGGVALEALGLGIQPGLRIIASLLLIVCGVAAAVLAWRGWMRAERALRRSASLPTPGYFLPVVMVVAAVGVLIFTAVLIR